MADQVEELLRKYEVVGIDTAPFIYHLEENLEYVSFTDTLFRMVEEGEIRGVTSTITLMEILVKPWQERDIDAIEEYKFVLSTFPNLKIMSIDTEVAEKAAEMRAKYTMRPPDALQLAVALVGDAQAFITNDEKMRRVREIDVTVMKEAIKRGG